LIWIVVKFSKKHRGETWNREGFQVSWADKVHHRQRDSKVKREKGLDKMPSAPESRAAEEPRRLKNDQFII